MSKETLDLLIALKKDYIQTQFGAEEEDGIPLSDLLTSDDLVIETDVVA